MPFAITWPESVIKTADSTSTRVESRPLRTVACEVERYILTGESDPLYFAWSGDLMERANRAHEDLRGALVREVFRLAQGYAHKPIPDVDAVALTRAKIEPMVRGLFPRAEQDSVLRALERSVVFLSSGNIEPVLMGRGFDRLAWDLANLYLCSMGAPLLSEDAPRIVGLSEETTCYVSSDYFADDDPFADFVIHEAAHIFHNCKRETLGLRSTRRKEWLLDIDFHKRETFAYSCEAYARIVVRAKNITDRRALAEEYGSVSLIFDDRADTAEVASILKEAVMARNGWKVILSRCSPGPRPHVQRVEPAITSEYL